MVCRREAWGEWVSVTWWLNLTVVMNTDGWDGQRCLLGQHRVARELLTFKDCWTAIIMSELFNSGDTCRAIWISLYVLYVQESVRFLVNRNPADLHLLPTFCLHGDTIRTAEMEQVPCSGKRGVVPASWLLCDAPTVKIKTANTSERVWGHKCPAACGKVRVSGDDDSAVLSSETLSQPIYSHSPSVALGGHLWSTGVGWWLTCSWWRKRKWP